MKPKNHSTFLTLLRLISFSLLVVFMNPMNAAEDSRLYQEAADRAAIEQLAYRYIHALDTRDADLYVSVFTEDAVYDIEGQILSGHEALRGFIATLQAGRDRAVAEGRTPIDLYHSNLNPMIDFISENEATFQAYWQTLRLGDDNAMRIGGMGIIRDTVVKTEGEWKIKKRVLTNFIERQ